MPRPRHKKLPQNMTTDVPLLQHLAYTNWHLFQDATRRISKARLQRDEARAKCDGLTREVNNAAIVITRLEHENANMRRVIAALEREHNELLDAEMGVEFDEADWAKWYSDNNLTRVKNLK